MGLIKLDKKETSVNGFVKKIENSDKIKSPPEDEFIDFLKFNLTFNSDVGSG